MYIDQDNNWYSDQQQNNSRNDYSVTDYIPINYVSHQQNLSTVRNPSDPNFSSGICSTAQNSLNTYLNSGVQQNGSDDVIQNAHTSHMNELATSANLMNIIDDNNYIANSTHTNLATSTDNYNADCINNDMSGGNNISRSGNSIPSNSNSDNAGGLSIVTSLSGISQ
jgi:hypothetical protein